MASLRYSVCLLDDQDPDLQTPLTGHSAVALAVAGCTRTAQGSSTAM